MEKIFGPSHAPSSQASEHWISMSDLMAGLMMVFLLISVAFMRYVNIEKEKIKEVAVAYQNAQVALYQMLEKEFSEDLRTWNAEIDQSTLEFRFKSPDVLFDAGKFDLKPQFAEILDDFFPRYMRILSEFRPHITEVRIEGHTSSDWTGSDNPDRAYFNNMALSQGRTRAVLEYLYKMPSLEEDRPWMKSSLAAVGFSSAHPVLIDGIEDRAASRRVTFKVLTNAELQIRRLIQE